MKLKLFHKIAFALVILSATISLIISFSSHYKYRETIRKDSFIMLRSIVENHGHDLDNQIINIEKYCLVLEAVFKQTIDTAVLKNDNSLNEYKNKIIPLLDTLSQKFKPLSYWIIFNPVYTNNGHTISFFDADMDGKFLREAEYSINDFDLSRKDMLWWVDAMRLGTVWTEPYRWENWNLNLISYSRRINIGTKAIAVLGSDIDFDKFKRNLETRKLYQSGFLWIINKEFNSISVDSEYNNKYLKVNTFIKNQLYHISQDSSRTNMFEYKSEDGKSIITFYQMINGWYLCSSTPKDEIFTDLNNTMNINMLIILMGIILSLGLAILISRTLTKPISQLVDLISQGVKGNLKVRANVGSTYEIRELSNYFNFFMDELDRKISDLKSNEQHLIDAKNKAEESDRLKSAFLANLSHEIRTPMNAIIGFTSLISMYEMDKPTMRNYIDLVQDNTFTLLNILDNIIEISILESQIEKSRMEEFSVNKLFQSLHDTFKLELNRLNKANINLEIDKQNLDNDIVMLGDKANISRILNHLLRNSIKFSDEHTIKFGCKKEADEYIFYVEDQGIGIPENELSNVFEPFFKASNITFLPIRGTGLGLAICKKIVDRIGGSIQINSKEGFGTKVEFRLNSLYK